MVSAMRMATTRDWRPFFSWLGVGQTGARAPHDRALPC
jgi:hypothetical protein